MFRGFHVEVRSSLRVSDSVKFVFVTIPADTIRNRNTGRVRRRGPERVSCNDSRRRCTWVGVCSRCRSVNTCGHRIAAGCGWIFGRKRDGSAAGGREKRFRFGPGEDVLFARREKIIRLFRPIEKTRSHAVRDRIGDSRTDSGFPGSFAATAHAHSRSWAHNSGGATLAEIKGNPPPPRAPPSNPPSNPHPTPSPAFGRPRIERRAPPPGAARQLAAQQCRMGRRGTQTGAGIARPHTGCLPPETRTRTGRTFPPGPAGNNAAATCPRGA